MGLRFRVNSSGYTDNNNRFKLLGLVVEVYSGLLGLGLGQ